MSFTRVVLRLCIGRTQKSYPREVPGKVKNTDYHTSKRPKGWISGNLPDPQLKGKMPMPDILHQPGNRGEDSIKKDWKKDDIGQILWAGYGSTPHWTHRALEESDVERQVNISRYCHQGKTVPSWNAEYGLEIYVSFEGGIYRYVSWDEDAAAPTHSLQDVDDAVVENAIRGMERDRGSVRIFIQERDARICTMDRGGMFCSGHGFTGKGPRA